MSPSNPFVSKNVETEKEYPQSNVTMEIMKMEMVAVLPAKMKVSINA
jgi:hypothetical protein